MTVTPFAPPPHVRTLIELAYDRFFEHLDHGHLLEAMEWLGIIQTIFNAETGANLCNVALPSMFHAPEKLPSPPIQALKT